MSLRERIANVTAGVRDYIAEEREWQKAYKIGFDYHLPGGDLDGFIKITDSVKKARGVVQASGGRARVGYGSPRGLSEIQHSFIVYGPDPGSVASAFRLFIKTAGIAPDFVRENYRLAEEVLGDFGKTLERRLDGGAIGKFVVDKKI